MAIVEVVPTTYSDIKTSISNILTTKGYDASYEGSNASILTDVLSYTASMLNLNTSFNTSEMLLTTASQEKNVRYLARQLGFEGQNIVSYQYSVTLECVIDSTLSVTDTSTRNYTIPKYAQFTSGSNNYYVISEPEPLILSNLDITLAASNPYYVTVTVKEGTLYLASDSSTSDILNQVVQTDASGNVINYIDIPLTNVEDDGVEVLLTYVDNKGNEVVNESWAKADQFLLDTDTNMQKRFIRIEDIDYGTPRLYFRLADIGTTLQPNTLVTMNVITSSGIAGIANGNMSVPGTLPNFTFVSQTMLVTGQAKEDMESVRTNAPLFHNSANRAVTKYDYIAICNRHAVVKYTQVWGGDEEIPINLGYVYISCVPQQRYNNRTFNYTATNGLFQLALQDDSVSNFIPSTELSSTVVDNSGNIVNPGIFDVLNNYKIITLQLLYRQPVYINFDYVIDILLYNSTLSREQTQTNVQKSISDYFSTDIEIGESTYFHSNIIKRIDTIITDTSGLNCSLTTSISLYKQNINTERSNTAEKSITFFLGDPFETYIVGTGLAEDILPLITTNTTYGLLTVDFSSVTYSDGATTPDKADWMYFPITLNGIVCGRYYVQLALKKYIRLDLYVKGTYGTVVDPIWVTTNLTEDMFTTVFNIALVYANNNFTVARNTFPRLTSMKFN